VHPGAGILLSRDQKVNLSIGERTRRLTQIGESPRHSDYRGKPTTQKRQGRQGVWAQRDDAVEKRPAQSFVRLRGGGPKRGEGSGITNNPSSDYAL
jgi:hypothetical protein